MIITVKYYKRVRVGAELVLLLATAQARNPPCSNSAKVIHRELWINDAAACVATGCPKAYCTRPPGILVSTFPLRRVGVEKWISSGFAFRFVTHTIQLGLTTRDARSSSDKSRSGYDNQIVGRFVYQCVPAMSTVNRRNVACACRPRRNAHRRRTTMTGQFGIGPS